MLIFFVFWDNICEVCNIRFQRVFEYKNEKKTHYEDTLRNYKRDEPIAHQNLEFSEELFNSLCDEFR